MPPPYNPNVPFVQDGEAVDAATVNRPSQTLLQDVGYLKDRVDMASLGQSLVEYGAACNPAVLVGQPVAWDPTTNQFEPAFSSVVVGTSGALLAGPHADCRGLVVNKPAASSCDVLMAGVYPVDLSNAVSPALPGRYYLSSATPGRLTAQRPPLAVPVCYYDGTRAYVAPTFQDFHGSHVHFRYDLACKPAGQNTLVSGGTRHSVTSADAIQRGWLPASHASFAGTAPAGAAFGYNVAADPNLSPLWPPVPLQSVTFVFDKGTDLLGGKVIRNGLNGPVYADNNGIWWMSDCLGDVPWPQTYDAGSPPAALPNATVPPTCPRPTAMRLTAFFVDMLVETGDSVVTSLVAKPGTLATVTDLAGNPASTGALEVGVNLGLSSDATVNNGYSVFKSIAGNVLKAGYVVEKLVAGSNVTLTSATTADSGASYQGVVTVSVDTDLGAHEIASEVVRLDDAKERYYGGDPYLALPANMPSGLRLKYVVPPTGLPAGGSGPGFKVRLWLYGPSSGTLPTLTMTYRRVPRPSGTTPVTFAASDSSLAVTTSLAVGTNQYLEVETTPVAVAAGDVVLVSVSRAAPDGYTDDVGLVRDGLVIVTLP